MRLLSSYLLTLAVEPVDRNSITGAHRVDGESTPAACPVIAVCMNIYVKTSAKRLIPRSLALRAALSPKLILCRDK